MRKENFNDLFAQSVFPPKEVEKELSDGRNWKVFCNETEVEELRETSVFALSQKDRAKLRYLMKDYVPANWPVEGAEEFPIVGKYEGTLPEKLIGVDEPIPKDCSRLGLHGFCYDYVLEPYWRDIGKLVKKARSFQCAFAPDFSVLADGRRCDVVEAIRRNRYSTIALQQNGIQTIQTASWGNADSLSIAFDGLAPHSPVAVEHNISNRDPARRRLFRIGVEKLIAKKSPSVLIVYGFPLDFEVAVPVVYYKCRIQKQREGYGKVGA